MSTPTAREIAARVRRGATTASEVVEHAVRAAFAAEDRLNAFNFVDVEGARERAEAVDAAVAAGEDPGPLAGVPFAVKDLIDQHGLLNTKGSSFDVEPAAATAPCVARLEAAGAIPIGRTGLHEFAFGFSSENEWFGPVRNPWDESLSPGGSSGGSGAAVGGAIVPFALGTDTGGSVRVPAALCGVVGLKVTHGRGSLRGVYPLVISVDTVGPIARTVDDAALMYGVIAAHDPADPWSAPRPVRGPAGPADLRGVRIGVPRPLVGAATDPVTEESFAAALAALREAGATVADVALPSFAPSDRVNDSLYFEVAALHEERLRDQPEGYGEEVRERLRATLRYGRSDYLAGLEWRAENRHALERAWADHDVLATPTVGLLRKEIGINDVTLGGEVLNYRLPLSRYTSVVNHTGVPALALPLAGHARPPASLQLIGPAWSEHRLLELGLALEEAGIVATPPPPAWSIAPAEGRRESAHRDID